MAAAEHESDLKNTTDTPYLTLTGQLWGVCYEDIGENWLLYNGTALYFSIVKWINCDEYWWINYI